MADLELFVYIFIAIALLNTIIVGWKDILKKLKSSTDNGNQPPGSGSDKKN